MSHNEDSHSENEYEYESENSSSEEMMNEDLDVEEIDTGSVEKDSVQINKVRKGGFILIDDHVCRVVDIVKVKNGKHGHAKAVIAGSDIFSGKRFEMHAPTHNKVDVPRMKRVEYKIINIDEDYLYLTDKDNKLRQDITLPSNDKSLRDRIVRSFEDCQNNDTDAFISVFSRGDQNLIIDCRIQQN